MIGSFPESARRFFVLASLVFACGISATPKSFAYYHYGDNPQTSVVVSWASSVSSPTVDYGLTTSYDSSATGTSVRNTSQGTNTYHNHVTITGLTAGTTYHYRYEGKTGGRFTTAAASGSFKFAVPGDVQYWEAICPDFRKASRWAAAEKNPSFWIPLGDVTSSGLLQACWDNLFKTADSLSVKSAFMPIMGNHDCTISGGTNDAYPQVWVDMMRFPNAGGGSTYPQCFYYFEYSNALFIMLNNHYNAEPFFPGIKNAQTTWLTSLLSKNTKPWKFVFSHDPSMPSLWVTAFKKYGVQAVFAGHTHSYAASFDGNLYKYTAEASYAQGTPTIPVVEVNGNSATVYTYNWTSGAVVFKQALVQPTAIKGLVNNSAIPMSVSPNPVSAGGTVSINSSEPAQIEIYDIRGRLMAVLSKGKTTTWNTRNIPAGIYVMKSVMHGSQHRMKISVLQ
jgi:hypothetical protein